MRKEFQEVFLTRHEYAKDWKKRTGGKVIGCFCCHVPEEIAYAAGILPVRILSSHEPQDLSEPYIFGMYCPFSRDCLGEGLKGRYNYLDGIVLAQSCLHIRQTFEVWENRIPVPYSHFIFMPAMVENRHALANLMGELTDFKTSLEKWTGRDISDESLDNAIDVYNTNRRLMREVYELRKGDEPPISGTEAIEMVLASMVMDKREHNQILQGFLEGLKERQNSTEDRPRLMVVGGENDDPELLRLIEEAGANIVADDMCMGSRYFWDEVIPEKDRLQAIAQRYLSRPSCPLKDISTFTDNPRRRRLNHIMGLIKEYNVQGVILIQQKFCDPQEFDIGMLLHDFREKNIPSLYLELDTTLSKGQVRTRTEAFLEMLEFE